MNILCYGDSNTYGYNPADGMRYPEDIRWPGVLRRLLEQETRVTGEGESDRPAAEYRAAGESDRPAAEYRVIEEGCNGRTASCTPEDEAWKDGRPYLPACLNSHKPLDRIILMLGSNDLKWMFHASPEDITEGIREILQIISEFTPLKQGYRPRVLLVSPPLIGEGITQSPFADSFEQDAVLRSQRLAGLYRKAAEDFTSEGLLDCDFLDASRICDPSKLDSLHLMPDAHAALARAAADWILGHAAER